MTRWELINSDEYITVTVECIVVSRKSIRKMRDELNDFFLQYRNEILHGNKLPLKTKLMEKKINLSPKQKEAKPDSCGMGKRN